MSTIAIESDNRKKVNKIYNQCVIYALIVGAISAPFVMNTTKAKSPRKSVFNTVPVSAGEATLDQPTLPISMASPILAKPESELASVAMATMQVIAKSLTSASMPIKSDTYVPVAQHKPAARYKPIVQHKPITQTKIRSAKPVISINNTKIDTRFIDKVEGPSLKAEVPGPRSSQSGVTIGSGVDLGQMNVSEFNQLTISNALKAKLRPYLGLKKQRAVAYLKAHPLKITAEEMNELTLAEENRVLKPLMENYKKSSHSSFEQLPAQAQTVLFSFAYQYGPGFKYKASTRQLWNYFVAQNWTKVKEELRGYKQYSSRRREEAQLIGQLA